MEQPLWQQLHEIRHRLDQPRLSDQPGITSTEVEGSIEDMVAVGLLEQVGEDQFRMWHDTADLTQIADDLRWWVNAILEAVETVQRRGEE